MFRAVLVVMGVVFCATGIWMIVIGRRGKERLQRLDAAMSTNARILDTRSERSGDSIDLWVHLQFEVGSETVDKEVSVSTPFFKKAKQGGYTRVKYHPQDPADFIIVEDRTARLEPTLFVAFGILFIIVGIGVAILGISGLLTLVLGT